MGREVDVQRLQELILLSLGILVRQYVVDPDRADRWVYRSAVRVFSDQVLQRVLVQRVPAHHGPPVRAQGVRGGAREIGGERADRIRGGSKAPPAGLPQRVRIFEPLEIVEIGNAPQLVPFEILPNVPERVPGFFERVRGVRSGAELREFPGYANMAGRPRLDERKGVYGPRQPQGFDVQLAIQAPDGVGDRFFPDAVFVYRRFLVQTEQRTAEGEFVAGDIVQPRAEQRFGLNIEICILLVIDA